MEKSKHSTEEIIKLGEKIIRELNIETRFDTLSSWMVHYVSELIYKAKNSNSEEEKKALEAECCDVILKIWSNREHISGVKTPLTDLKPLIEILKALNQKDRFKREWPLFLDGFDDNNKTMKDFIESVKSNTEDIFLLGLYSTLGSDLIKQKKELKEDFEEFLNEDEKKLLDQIYQLLNPIRIKFYSSKTDKKDEQNEIKLEDYSEKDWQKFILDRIESHLDDQKSKLRALKEKL